MQVMNHPELIKQLTDFYTNSTLLINSRTFTESELNDIRMWLMVPFEIVELEKVVRFESLF